MTHDHVVELPKAVWGIKIAQSVIALLVLAFSAFTIAVIPNGYSGFCIWTAVFSGIALIYYFVSVTSNKHLFNWIALLVLECFAVLWWLVVWAILATALAAAAYVESTYNDDYYSYKRSLVKRFDNGSWTAAGILVYVTMALGVINWILYIVTLVFISKAVHHHRKAGKPMQAGGGFNTFNNASREEKHDMQPMPSGPAYNNNNNNNYGAQNGQATAPQPMQYEHQQQQAPVYPQNNSYPSSPVPTNTHEVYGGNRYP